ncbi:MAG TPA: hypothetical protein VFE38_00545 [Edaphobacter sp.]|nr:hypothetical protein [Edaphobacter sp.]
MVTAAMIATMPGVEASSPCSASSGEANIVGMPFAVSLAAEMAVSAPGQIGHVEQTEQGTDNGSVPAAKGDNVHKLATALTGKFAASTTTPEKESAAKEGIDQDGAEPKTSTGNAKVLIPVPSVKVAAVQSEEKETAEIADGVPVLDQGETCSIAASIETATAAADVVDYGIQPSSAQAEDVKAAKPNEAEAEKATAIISECAEKMAGLDVKDGLTDMVAGSTSNKATTKSDGEVEKKGKAGKVEKAEKDATENDESTTSLAAVSTPVAAQLAAPSANPAQGRLDKGQESVGLPTSKVTAGAKRKPVSVTNDKNAAKEAGGAKHPDVKSGIEMAAKLPIETDPKRLKSSRETESLGVTLAGVESTKTHNDGTADHVEGAAGGNMGIVPAAHLVHVKAIVSPPERVSPQGTSMQHGTALQGDARSDVMPQVEAAPRTIVATPTVLEVGVANGTHGWLKIRAEMTDAGTVNASLATASTSGQEILHHELPSLTAYLHNERVAVNTIVVQQTSTAAPDLRGHTGGMIGDGRGQAGQNGGQPGSESRHQPARVQDSVYRMWGEGQEAPIPLTLYPNGGGWLSVMA